MPFDQLDVFAIPDALKIVAGHNGLPKMVITTPQASAEIYLLGAHITSFQPVGQEEILWVSPKSPFVEGKGIRGGVPLCWPWFGPHKTDKTQPTHGFARMRSWNLLSSGRLHDGRVQVELGLESNEQTLAIFPHAFSLVLIITIGSALSIELLVSNTGREAFSFENCFHSYFRTGDASKARVLGATDVACLDRNQAEHRSIQNGPVNFEGEVNKVMYLGQQALELDDPVQKRRIAADNRNTRQTVIWNPGAVNATKMPEIENHWAEFVCIEAANCLDMPVHLAPGLSHCSAVYYRIAGQ